ncbi:MAG: allantoate amidohydrolase [Glaciimonas sp.]|nr:allantoate amidohydrolase [Glaciimonas sp.]
MTVTLTQLNTCDATNFVSALKGVYEHSPWVAQRAAAQRPFATLAALKLALQDGVKNASEAEQLGLIRAHPELAGKVALAGSLSTESRSEQARAGLNHCSPAELAALQQLNADYHAKFSFPFIVAVKGPDGFGLSRQTIIAIFKRRLRNQRADELAECLRQIGRIAELRLNDVLGHKLEFGHTILAWADALALWSDVEDGLTCAFMTPAHRNTAAQLAEWMRNAGLQTEIDAVGNVVGRYRCNDPHAKTLLTGSHYDTVRNGGKYDGRIGILVPIAVLRQLHEHGEKLPFHVEIIGFAEEEGVRFQSTFLGSNAVIGEFSPALLEQVDADGMTMRAALIAAGHDPAPERITACAHQSADLLGFIEIHIEQGPVLLGRDMPVGIVSSIAGSLRYQIVLTGVAGHSGTTPMTMRRDAAAAAAEIILLVERRCSQAPTLVGTVGQLQVPHGSINVIAGTCNLSLDIRAADDATRDAAAADVLQQIAAICAQRNIDVALERVEVSAAAPCAPWLMHQLALAVERAGIPAVTLPSGAGHDAMMLAKITDVAMLFMRCGNGGISHNRLETITADDTEIAAQIFLDFLRSFRSAR